MVSVESAAAFRSAFDLTKRQYYAIRKLAERNVPPLKKIKSWTKTVFDEANLVDKRVIDGEEEIRMVYWSQPDLIMKR